MVRRATTEPVQEEVAHLAVPVSLDDTSTKRLRADATDTASVGNSHHLLYLFEESYADRPAQWNAGLAIQGTTWAPSDQKLSNAKSGTLEDLPGKKGATCPFPSQPSGNMKRKHDAPSACEGFSRHDHDYGCEINSDRQAGAGYLVPSVLGHHVLWVASSLFPTLGLTLWLPGHRALWKMGIYNRNVSVVNMMWDSAREMGALIDFDLTTSANQTTESDNHRISSTSPSVMALELLEDEGMKGLIPPLYRQELEFFTWVLIYLCYTMRKRANWKFAFRFNKYIKKWFLDTEPGHIQAAKLDPKKKWDDEDLRPLLYTKFAPLARDLHYF